MTLTTALDIVYGHTEWANPIRPNFVTGVTDTPYEAYLKLKPEYQKIVVRLIEHEPTRTEE